MGKMNGLVKPVPLGERSKCLTTSSDSSGRCHNEGDADKALRHINLRRAVAD